MVSISGPPKGWTLGLLLGWGLLVLQVLANIWIFFCPTVEIKCSWGVIAKFTVAAGRWYVLVKFGR